MSFDIEAIASEIAKAVDEDRSVQVNLHGVESLDYAIDTAEKIAGTGSDARIRTQPSCWVVSVISKKAEVTFFVRKETENHPF